MGKYGNVAKKLSLSFPNWRRASSAGLTGIRASGYAGNRLITPGGHVFLNMVSCSYLGLDRHPKIIEGAARAVQEAGTMLVATSRARIGLSLINRAEEALSEAFDCHTFVTPSCYSASAALLPVLASGHLTDGRKPVMIFDRFSHFSMNVMKATCGDETEILVCDHTDLDFIEDVCRRNELVAYVGDGAYSLGGTSPVRSLGELQQRYGLFLYLDDSHSLSVYGSSGTGFVKSELGTLSDRTLVVASLGKAFGAVGGVVMMGSRRHQDFLDFGGGPLGWSQTVNSAGLGAIIASAHIHLSAELQERQQRLRNVMTWIDRAVPTGNSGTSLPIRLIYMPSVDDAVVSAKRPTRQDFTYLRFTSRSFPRGQRGCG